VGAFIEDEAGGLDGISEVFNAGYAAGAESVSVHQEGVELDASFAGEEASATGVEGGVIFEGGDGGFYCVGGSPAFFENGVSGGEGMGYSALMVFGHLGWNGPGAAVNEEDGSSGWRLHEHVSD
jgi:hypothetical protein